MNAKVYGIDRVKDNYRVQQFLDGHLHKPIQDYDCIEFIKNIQPTVVVHCASDIQVGESVQDPGKYYDNNVGGTVTFLEYVRQACDKLPLVLFSSSAGVYGNPPHGAPATEQSPTQPINPYGETKLMVERILQHYSQAYGMNSVCFRYFNAAGASELGQKPGATHIIARALEAKLHNKKFTIFGKDYPTKDGTCLRDYIHVTDIANAHILAVMADKQGHSIFNLGTGQGATNKEIVDTITKHIGTFDYEYGPVRAGDPAALVANATLIRDELNWVPKHSDLNKIITSAWTWYNEQAGT